MSLKVKVGDPLPSVGLRATDGYLLNLRSFVTRQPALLVFFGAPTMAAGASRRRGLKTMDALVAGHERLREAGIAIAAISTDSEEQQTAFVAKHELPFLLLSDERRSAVNVLGVETVADGANVNVAKPMALAVDVDGAIRAVWDPIDPDALVDQAMRALSEPIPTAASDTTAPPG